MVFLERTGAFPAAQLHMNSTTFLKSMCADVYLALEVALLCHGIKQPGKLRVGS
jgi:hypothetical protein